jgi:nitroreductase
METLEAILSRRSVRDYISQPIPDQILRQLLEAAMQAPSAGNQKPWHFIMLTDSQVLDALARVLPYSQCLAKAPLGIAVCADLLEERYPGYWVQDCSAATENILLASHALGLGAVWLGIYPVEDRVINVKKVLVLPETVIPLSIVSLGYPSAAQEPPQKRYDALRVHKNHW